MGIPSNSPRDTARNTTGGPFKASSGLSGVSNLSQKETAGCPRFAPRCWAPTWKEAPSLSMAFGLLLLSIYITCCAVPLAAQTPAKSPPRAVRGAAPTLDRERLDALNQLHREQLRAAEAERRRADEQITALRAQGQLIAAEKMREQLVNSQRNQQLQLEYMTRRAHLQSILSLLLFVCLMLTVALAWSLWRINLARRQQALEDPLTGLKNRRFLQPFMEHETERLRRSGLTALILIADIDFFKEVNDRWGHEVGDQALVQFSKTLRSCMRNSDVVSRWGGEEFLIICPQSAEFDAEIICNRIRQRLQQTQFVSPGESSFHLTISIGAALFSPATFDEHWEGALARADKALYYVKKNGRDNWFLSTPEHTPFHNSNPAAL